MPINYAQLQAELNTDPNAYGYAAPRAAGNDEQLAALVNQVRPALPQLERPSLTPQQLVEALVLAEYTALTQAQRDYLNLLVTCPLIDVRTGTTARAALLAVFGAGTTTRANLLAVVQRQVSRAENLFGVGTVVSAADVARALRG